MESCPSCGYEGTSRGLGMHFSKTDHYPSLSNYQKELLTGILMSDGTVDGGIENNPRIKVEMINREFLEWFDSKMGVHTTGLFEGRSAEECYQSSSNIRTSDSDPSNYNQTYVVRTRRSSEIQEFAEWYSSGSKVWPRDLELTPKILKMLYIGDGDINKSQIRISMSNEADDKKYIESLFSNVGFNVSRWDVWERANDYGGERTKVVFDVDTSRDMFEYMGKPVPGFEYKWPDEVLADA